MLKKIIDSINIKDYEVLTDTGWETIDKALLTVEYQEWVLETETKRIICADNHIVFDFDMNEKFVKDLSIGQYIYTKDGLEKVINLVQTENYSNMFDLQLNENSNRRYYTNDILSHNTLILGDIAAQLVRSGYNVIYFSAEMSEDKISKRIDANILDVDIKTFNDKELNEEKYIDELKRLESKFHGRLKVKEYPVGTATALHLKAYIDELKLKDNFIPDFLVLDYLNIFASSRLPASASLNSYIYVKAIIEEMRALTQNKDNPTCMITATQLNKEGSRESADKIESGAISESYGTAMTADWIGGIIQNEELFKQNKYLFKVLKTRFDGNNNFIYTVGVEREKMKLKDLEENEQEIPLHIKEELIRKAKETKKEKDFNELNELEEEFNFNFG